MDAKNFNGNYSYNFILNRSTVRSSLYNGGGTINFVCVEATVQTEVGVSAWHNAGQTITLRSEGVILQLG